MNPRQGDLFLYGTESLICPINRKGSWVGCLGWQRGWARTFFLSNFFPFQPFSFISDKNRLMKVPNSYFFLNIFKNRLKWIKDPNLHDSPEICQEIRNWNNCNYCKYIFPFTTKLKMQVVLKFAKKYPKMKELQLLQV